MFVGEVRGCQVRAKCGVMNRFAKRREDPTSEDAQVRAGVDGQIDAEADVWWWTVESGNLLTGECRLQGARSSLHWNHSKASGGFPAGPSFEEHRCKPWHVSVKSCVRVYEFPLCMHQLTTAELP